MRRKIIGLDLSINNTGIYLSNGDYHIITSKMTKEIANAIKFKLKKKAGFSRFLFLN